MEARALVTQVGFYSYLIVIVTLPKSIRTKKITRNVAIIKTFAS
jgi:hypothetical protein